MEKYNLNKYKDILTLEELLCSFRFCSYYSKAKLSNKYIPTVLFLCKIHTLHKQKSVS